MNFSQLQIALWTLVRKESTPISTYLAANLVTTCDHDEFVLCHFGNLVGSRIGQMGGATCSLSYPASS